MDTVTYPNPRAAEFVKDWMIGLRVDVKSQRDLAMEFQIQYTPTVIILDENRKEHYRSVGFHPPDQLLPELMVAAAKVHYQNKQFRQALALSKKMLADYPRNTWAAEASKLEAASRAHVG